MDVHEPRTLDTVSRYVLHERPADSPSPFVFLVGGTGPRRLEPLSYAAPARLFARRLDALGLRAPDKTPHALRHTHATAMWEGGMRELALMRPLGHASPESVRIYTRVSDEQVRAEYAAALQAGSLPRRPWWTARAARAGPGARERRCLPWLGRGPCPLPATRGWSGRAPTGGSPSAGPALRTGSRAAAGPARLYRCWPEHRGPRAGPPGRRVSGLPVPGLRRRPGL